MFFSSFFFLSLVSLCLSQQPQCIFQSGNYTLNLTLIRQWTLELETPQHFYYYTPCRNGLNCFQGNANFANNAAQFKQGANQCEHYLAVDHHELPSYSFYGASWRFSYEDGELCQQTQQPRSTTIYYHCDEEQQMSARLTAVTENEICNYVYSIASPLACVPANQYNAQCQWRVSDGQGGYYRLDLSSLNQEVIHTNLGTNGYSIYYSPCHNGLHCYQQYPYPVMSQIDNRQTGTCDHYLSVWEDGRVQPIFHNNNNQKDIHWSFHYYNGEKCSNGNQGYERIRWFCDPSVDSYQVINATSIGNCEWEINLATKLACPTTAEKAREEFFAGY